MLQGRQALLTEVSPEPQKHHQIVIAFLLNPLPRRVFEMVEYLYNVIAAGRLNAQLKQLLFGVGRSAYRNIKCLGYLHTILYERLAAQSRGQSPGAEHQKRPGSTFNQVGILAGIDRESVV